MPNNNIMLKYINKFTDNIFETNIEKIIKIKKVIIKVLIINKPNNVINNSGLELKPTIPLIAIFKIQNIYYIFPHPYFFCLCHTIYAFV